MTAIAARAGALPDPGIRSRADAMLAAMHHRGRDASVVHADAAAAVGAAWYAWEAGLTGASHIPVARRGARVVAADATLYYRDALRATLKARGALPPSDSSADLILATYEAFGDACVQHLEGDFAFVLWDGDAHLLLAARDFVGKRPLHYGVNGGAVTVASSVGGVIADPGMPDALDLGSIAASASGLWAHVHETCYAAVGELPAGHVLVWTAQRGARVTRFWSPPAEMERRPAPTDDAAAELRALLVSAVNERMAPRGVTALTLSGGWDSTAVWGSGQQALASQTDATRTLQPVSISYPPGDPGREDELITQAASFWRGTPSWIDINSVEMFARARELAQERDEPSAHPFEQWHRALARTSLDAGARVVLDGSGGDQLFQVSEVLLADLVRRGHLLAARREWHARGGTGFRAFLGAAVRPALSDRTLRLLAAVRGAGRPAHYLDRTTSPWFRADFLARESVLERELAARPALPRSSTVLAETHAYLTYPYFPRVTSRVAAYMLDEGLEARSPLLDNRVVRFAAGRPWYERAKGMETKILLRRAMHGLLPDSLLAPRTHRTGVTSGFFARSLLGPGRALIEELVTNPIMADLGMIDPAVLRRCWDYYLNTGHEEAGGRIYFTVQTELWLRERRSAPVARPGPGDAVAPNGN